MGWHGRVDRAQKRNVWGKTIERHITFLDSNMYMYGKMISWAEPLDFCSPSTIVQPGQVAPVTTVLYKCLVVGGFSVSNNIGSAKDVSQRKLHRVNEL